MIYGIPVSYICIYKKEKKNKEEREREREIDSIIEYIVDRQSRDRKFIPSHVHVHGYRARKTCNGSIEKYTAV